MTATSQVPIDRQLNEYHPSSTRWAAWQTTEPALRGFDFAGLRGALLDHSFPPGRKDELLAALIRLGQHQGADDAKTATTVCLLPGLRSIVRRHGDILGPHDAWGELVAALWERLSIYDLQRRPLRVAANLLWDSAHQVIRASRRERLWRSHVVFDNRTEGTEPDRSLNELRLLELAVAVGVLTEVDGTLIDATRLGGITLAEAAILLGLSYEAAKKRRQRAEAAWVAWWAPERRSSFSPPADHSLPSADTAA